MKILTSPTGSEPNIINRVVITGYYSKVSVQESSIFHLARNFFGKWEHLEHLEIAVTSNRSVWHSCYEKVVSRGHIYLDKDCLLTKEYTIGRGELC